MVGLATTILLVFPLCVTLFFTFLHFSPFCTYIVHPPQQKVTPRRGGETRQMAFRTRQVCEGADHRVAVKGNDTTTNQNTVPRTETHHIQEAALRACLEGQVAKNESV